MDNYQHLINIIKQVEVKLQWESSANWSNRDYIELSQKIQEETGTQLSTSSLRRIFAHVDQLPENYTPQRETRDALCKFVGYDSWYHYIERAGQKSKRSWDRRTLILVPIIVLFLAILFFWLSPHDSPVVDKAPVEKYLQFEGEHLYSNNFPNTVIVKYKVKGYKKPLRIFWDDGSVDGEQTSAITVLKGDSGTVTHTYFDKDLSKIILQDADRKILSTLSTFVSTNGWECFVKQDDLHFSVDAVHFSTPRGMAVPYPYLEERGVVESESYRVFYRHNADFGIDGKAFTFHTVFKPLFREDYVDCSHVQILVAGTKGQFFITLAQEGCAGIIKSINLNKKLLKGVKTDLSAYTVQNKEWADFKIKVKNNQAVLLLNENEIYNGSFPGELGDMMCIRVEFKGNGVLRTAEYVDEVN